MTLSDLRAVAGPGGNVKLTWSKDGWALVVRQGDGTIWVGRLVADANGTQLEELFARACRALAADHAMRKEREEN